MALPCGAAACAGTPKWQHLRGWFLGNSAMTILQLLMFVYLTRSSIIGFRLMSPAVETVPDRLLCRTPQDPTGAFGFGGIPGRARLWIIVDGWCCKAR